MYGRKFSVIGTVILVFALVGCAQRQAPAPVERVYRGPTIHDFEANSLSGDRYTVQRGDTLYSIAFRANIDVRTLARLNSLGEPYTIYPGQSLRLRATTRQTTGATSTTSVDSGSKKEYVEDKSKEKVTRRSTEPAPERRATTPTLVPSQPRDVFPASNAINWRWPSKNQVIRGFSTAAAGNKGLDFGGSKGDPVYAAAAGKVVYAGNALKGYGNLIILKHNDDYITAYAHNDRLLVSEQQWVSAGDEIAVMGDTDAEQVKLHFEVRFRGKSVNPRHYLPRGSQ